MLCFRLRLIADKDHLRRSVVSLECPFSHRHVESAAMQQASHSEHHYIHRIGWIRAAVLGANDGILSIASLLMGVAAATQDQTTLLVSGIAGLTAGAFSMAAGEFVSVSSQADIERADLAIERRAIAENPEDELAELAEIYRSRGLEAELATEVARQLMAHDPLGAHARDELGMTEFSAAKPYQAAAASAFAFSLGAAIPLLAALVSPNSLIMPATAMAAIIALAVLGAISARASGASVVRAVFRVSAWGIAAMAITSGIGTLIGIAL